MMYLSHTLTISTRELCAFVFLSTSSSNIDLFKQMYLWIPLPYPQYLKPGRRSKQNMVTEQSLLSQMEESQQKLSILSKYVYEESEAKTSQFCMDYTQ